MNGILRLLLLLLVTWAAGAACIPPPNTYDYEAQLWGSQATYSGAAYRAGTVFMQQAKWWGLRPYLGRVNLYVGSDTNGLVNPIIRDWFSTSDNLDSLVAFTAADFSETTGLTGNTTTKVLYPNGPSFPLRLSDKTTATNVHMAVYVRTPTNEASYNMGCIGLAPQFIQYTFYVSGANNGTFNLMGTNYPSAPDTNGVGFYVQTRSAVTNAATYKNGVVLVTSTVTDNSPLPAGYMVVHACHADQGVDQLFSSRTLSYYAVGLAIPDPLAKPYNDMVQNVQIRMGRQK